jgi:hypothetical protein
MLGKTSVSMMVLLVAASLIGISSIHQYVEGQTPPPAATPQPKQLPTKFEDIKGQVLSVVTFAGEGCNAWVKISGEGQTPLGLPGGTAIVLGSADHSICTSLGLAKIGKINITFDAQKASEVVRLFSTSRVVI